MLTLSGLLAATVHGPCGQRAANPAPLLVLSAEKLLPSRSGPLLLAPRRAIARVDWLVATATSLREKEHKHLANSIAQGAAAVDAPRSRAETPPDL